ncbi:MAG: PEP-CTERM sorting domain-containing protein [Kiritimatiellae bacterium]|nr:PEP-CTERM sorting domain-containing protein [Kiritimatiellia bacterium]MDD4341942.1 PEP-CTERM sorting domain-containing protein [Kiritimatiellia bacterium]
MKKLIIFAVVAMVASFASAQTLTWIGDSAVYHVEETTWYNASANWATPAFDGADFGLVSSLTLGANAYTYWDDAASHTGTSVEMGWLVDSGTAQGLSLPHLEVSGNNDKWEDMTGVNVASGVDAGTHTVAVWFHANDGGTTDVYDNNASANYVADFETAIPEPATMSLLGLGALAMVLRRKIRK